jgi:predicted esterase
MQRTDILFFDEAPMQRTFIIGVLVLLYSAPLLPAQAPFERKVAAATRLDWEFAVRGFPPADTKVPAGFDSTKQKYHLFVPKTYKKDKPAALVLFISAGDTPAGWKNWQKFCEAEGAFFASPYGAGNSTPAGQRTRIILDVLDDVRRAYKIDPDQTYITGFSGGGRMCCTIGFALPEYFGGVIPLCGTNPIPGPAFQRHRVEERLSVAFVTGENDMNRKENEEYMYPWFQEIGVRSKLWVMPKMGHVIPPASVVAEVHAWLAEDLKRRRDEAKVRPKLAVAADDTPSPAIQAKRWVEAGQADLKDPMRTWRGVALLQGVTQRFGKTAAANEARATLKKIGDDETLLQRIEVQGTDDEVKSISAQAKALERFGNLPKAIEAWSLLAKNYDGTPAGTKAVENIARLRAKAK